MTRISTDLRRLERRRLAVLASVVAMMVGASAVQAATVTVVNNCGYTVYPGVYPPVYQNGGWSQAAGASVSFTLNNTFTGRLWGRTGCNTGTSPAQCATGSCGGTGLQCAGTTGHPNTSLFEINVDAAGTDWYNVSYVDAIDNPIGVRVSNGACRSPNTCTNAVKTSCPADLVSGSSCLSPCTRYSTDQLCCRGAFGTPQTCVTSQWPASARTYLNNVHSFCPSQYAYAYDESNDALHTCPTGANYTVTFCPSGGGTAPPRVTPTPTPTPRVTPTPTPTSTPGTAPTGNIALNRPVLASSAQAAEFAAGFAVDGNTGTRWSSAFADPQWIRVDLGTARSINRVILRWEAAFGRSYQIQTSPNGNAPWTTIFSTTTGDGGVDDLAVSGNARYIRMNGTVRATVYGYSLFEMEVYSGGGNPGVPTPTPTPTPTPGGVATPTPTPTPTSGPAGWNLVFADEFNGTGAPNSANWSYHVGNGFNTGAGGFGGWGNGEWEWYRPENCTQSGGNLNIRADWLTTPMNIAGRSWFQRSCRITTQGKRSWTYGRIEVRAAAPHAAGAWPAVWMMGTSSGGTNSTSYTPAMTYYDTMATNWASCGEVDILEKRNYENININNIYWDLRTGVFPWTAGQNANYGTSAGFGDLTQFHVYAIEWDQTFIRWFVDNQQTHEINITPATLEEFRKPLYIIMNLALAGAFPQMDPNPAEFPLTMRVDYVRVYQRP